MSAVTASAAAKQRAIDEANAIAEAEAKAKAAAAPKPKAADEPKPKAADEEKIVRSKPKAVTGKPVQSK
jgi:hypothetical protein